MKRKESKRCFGVEGELDELGEAPNSKAASIYEIIEIISLYQLEQ